jgi:hypothetical protein
MIINSKAIYQRMQSEYYSALAARRYRQYTRKQRNEHIRKGIVSFLFELFKVIVKALQKAKILRPKVESVTVE